MKFGKKIAQTATEYLIILAVVIIIALIVVGVLGGIPGIGGSTSANVASAYWQTSTIGVDGYKISSGGNDAIILKNNNAVDIDIVNMSLGNQVILNTSSANITILKGRSSTISADEGLTLQNDDFLATSCAAGDAFSQTLTVVYLDKNTDALYTFVSEQKLEGECAA